MIKTLANQVFLLVWYVSSRINVDIFGNYFLSLPDRTLNNLRVWDVFTRVALFHFKMSGEAVIG